MWQLRFRVQRFRVERFQGSGFRVEGKVSVFSVRCSGLIKALRSCETTHGWNSEPQNIEQEISNDEVRNHFALTISDE